MSEALAAPASLELRDLVRLATLAPSSHNTQPWRFRVGASAVDLYADRSRRLPLNDPSNRELVISCGCALFNLRAAAAGQGLAVRVDPLPDGPGADRLAHIAAPSLTAALNVIETAAGKRLCAALVAEAAASQWSDPAWRRELAAWMGRPNGDGLPMAALAAPVTRFIVSRFNLGRRVGAQDAALVESAPALILLSTAGDEPDNWLAAGQALERVLLTARVHGLQASFFNQPVEVESVRPRLAAIGGGVPQILLRLGEPAGRIPQAPRRPLDEVID